MFPAFAELGLKVQKASLTSLTINRNVINPGEPDYDHLHEVVQEALNPPPDLDDSIEASTGTGSGEATDESSGSADADEPTDTEGSDPSSPDAGIDPTEEPDPTAPVDVTTAC
jgi:hypothetical protein